MVVKVIPRFSAKEIRRLIQKKQAAIEDAIILALKKVGEEFVRNARSTNTYKDQTGNLRSSIGYVILKNGAQMFADFGGRTSDGPEKARQVAEDVAGKFGRGYILIGVAGMEYAAAVEARGYDVITSSSQTAETSLRNALARIKSKIAA
jgi:hypothetical protein